MERPDYVPFFRDVIEHPDCTMLDAVVYGYIYWFTKLKNEKCFAGNDMLAQLAQTTPGSISQCLNHLDKAGFIKRIYEDNNPNKGRLEIVPLLVVTQRVLVDTNRGISPDSTGVLVQTKQNESIRSRAIKKQHATQRVAVSKDEKIPIPNADNFFKDGREKWDMVTMSLSEFVLMCRASKWSHIRLIGEYADERKPEFSTRGQWKEFGKRNMRPARRLSPYTDRQLDAAISRMQKDLKANGGFISKWSLETLEKYLD